MRMISILAGVLVASAGLKKKKVQPSSSFYKDLQKSFLEGWSTSVEDVSLILRSLGRNHLGYKGEFVEKLSVAFSVQKEAIKGVKIGFNSCIVLKTFDKLFILDKWGFFAKHENLKLSLAKNSALQASAQMWGALDGMKGIGLIFFLDSVQNADKLDFAWKGKMPFLADPKALTFNLDFETPAIGKIFFLRFLFSGSIASENAGTFAFVDIERKIFSVSLAPKIKFDNNKAITLAASSFLDLQSYLASGHLLFKQFETFGSYVHKSGKSDLYVLGGAFSQDFKQEWLNKIALSLSYVHLDNPYGMLGVNVVFNKNIKVLLDLCFYKKDLPEIRVAFKFNK